MGDCSWADLEPRRRFYLFGSDDEFVKLDDTTYVNTEYPYIYRKVDDPAVLDDLIRFVGHRERPMAQQVRELPDTPFQAKLRELDACPSGRLWVGGMTFKEAWERAENDPDYDYEGEARNSYHSSWMGWLVYELYPDMQNLVTQEGELVEGLLDDAINHHECDRIRELFPYEDLRKLLGVD